MDAKYQYRKIKTMGNGWVIINVNQISDIKQFPNGIALKMSSGATYLLTGNPARKLVKFVGEMAI